MIHPWKNLAPGKDPPNIVTAVVEIPGRSRNKYEIDKESGLFKLDRVLYSSVHYPAEYGIIPRTLHEDGDPLDIMVYIEEPTFTGCMIECRPIGVMHMKDRGVPDDKVFAVSTTDPLTAHINTITDLPGHYLHEVTHFFRVYKDLEGKRVEVTGWSDPEKAKAIINECIARFAKTIET